jgi:hypothetical protein
MVSCGFRHASKCLEHQEGVFLEEMENIPALRSANAEYAAKHEQYMRGWVEAARLSLTALIEKGH